MQAEHHTFQSNGGKQSGFGCLVREKKKECERPELKSLQSRLFSECQRSHYTICTERAKQSGLHSFAVHANTHSHYLLYDTESLQKLELKSYLKWNLKLLHWGSTHCSLLNLCRLMSGLCEFRNNCVPQRRLSHSQAQTPGVKLLGSSCKIKKTKQTANWQAE